MRVVTGEATRQVAWGHEDETREDEALGGATPQAINVNDEEEDALALGEAAMAAAEALEEEEWCGCEP